MQPQRFNRLTRGPATHGIIRGRATHPLHREGDIRLGFRNQIQPAEPLDIRHQLLGISDIPTVVRPVDHLGHPPGRDRVAIKAVAAEKLVAEPAFGGLRFASQHNLGVRGGLDGRGSRHRHVRPHIPDPPAIIPDHRLGTFVLQCRGTRPEPDHMPIFDIMHRMNLRALGIEIGLEGFLDRCGNDDVVVAVKEANVAQGREIRQHHP